LFIFFGGLSDKIGRKGIMMAGMILGVICYRPIFEKMYQTVNLNNKEIIASSVKTVTSSSIIQGTSDSLLTKTTTSEYSDGTKYKKVSKITLLADKSKDAPKAEDKITISINSSDKWTLVLMVFFLISFVTMAYGPIAAFLVEMFPTKIRYTSMSLPYHIGNGVFGGLMPAIATYLVTTANAANQIAEEAGNSAVYAKPYLEGLNYPIALISVCIVIGLIYIKGSNRHMAE
jgi:MFS family permease